MLETVPHEESEWISQHTEYKTNGCELNTWLIWIFALVVPVPVVCASLPDIYVEKLLGFVAACLEKSGHLQFYMTWAQNLLMLHGQKLKNRCAPSPLRLFIHHVSVYSWLTWLSLRGAGQEPYCRRSRRCRRASRDTLTASQNCKSAFDLSDPSQTTSNQISDQKCVISLHRCDFNKYNIRYAVALSKQRGIKRAVEEDDDEEEEELSEGMSEASIEGADMVL